MCKSTTSLGVQLKTRVCAEGQTGWTRIIVNFFSSAGTSRYTRLMIQSGLGLRVKHVLDPVKADFRVRISGLGASKVSPRGRICGPIASMRCCRLNDTVPCQKSPCERIFKTIYFMIGSIGSHMSHSARLEVSTWRTSSSNTLSNWIRIC